MSNSTKRRKVVRRILWWYRRNGRVLPWRNISNPYRILVSEIMLQQTHVRRVLVKYPEFLRRFPSVRALAAAERREVIVAWRGMGYNNRAVRLHRFAQAVAGQYRGRIPRSLDALLPLPGIGRYTAYAVLSSAFGMQLPVVDVNVQRVLSRIFWRMESLAAVRRSAEIWQLAGDLLPEGRAYDWNQALMDFGATLCTARNPDCAVCPVAGVCASRARMKSTTLRPRHPEPAMDGTPNRFYRGRIIEHLRTIKNSRGVRLDLLGRRIHPKFSRRHERWLRALVAGLQRDGLVRVRTGGAPRTVWIGLA